MGGQNDFFTAPVEDNKSSDFFTAPIVADEPSEIPTVTLSEQEVSGGKPDTNLPIPSPSQYEPRLRLSGKDISLMQKATDAAFSTSDIFKGEKGQRNKDIYYSALLKQGYTPDDVALIKGEQPEKYTSTVEPKPTTTPQQQSYSVTVTDSPMSMSGAIIPEVGGKKNYDIMRSTIDLFTTDDKYLKADVRQTYYKELENKGIRLTPVFKNNVENAVTKEKLIEGKSDGWLGTLVNPVGTSARVAPEMVKAGVESMIKTGEMWEGGASLPEVLPVGAKGLAEMALGAMSVTPVGIKFITAIETAHKVAPKAVDVAMAPVTATWKHLGMEEPETETGKALLWFADQVMFGLFLSEGHNAKKYGTAEYKKFVDNLSGETANTAMKIKELSQKYGQLTPEQKANAANLWADMQLKKLDLEVEGLPQGQKTQYRKELERLQKASRYREQNAINAETPQGTFIPPINDVAKVVESATIKQQGEKAQYEQVKVELTEPEAIAAPSIENVSKEIAPGEAPKHFEALTNYIKDFDTFQPINEVASGISVKYQGRNGWMGRSETGEVTFTDYLNGKTEIITGGGDVTPFNQKGLKLNEGTYKDANGEYFVQGDNKGYTVYEVKNGKLKKVYDGENANKSRKDAIIRKALNKTELEMAADATIDRVMLLESDVKKAEGTPAEPMLTQALEQAKQDAAIKGEEAIVEQHAQAMERVVEVELKEQIEQLEITSESLSDAGKQAIAPEISQARTILKEMEAKNEVAPEAPMESKTGDPLGVRSQEAAEPIVEPTKAGSGGGGDVENSGLKLEGSPREIIKELKSRKDDKAIHAEIFQKNGYNVFIYDNNKILADKTFKTHEEAKKHLDDWSSENGKDNQSKYDYGTITDIANPPYRQEITGNLPKDFIDKNKAVEQSIKEPTKPKTNEQEINKKGNKEGLLGGEAPPEQPTATPVSEAVKTPVEKPVETPPEPSPKQPVEPKPQTTLEQAKSRLAAAKEAANKLRDVSKLGTMSDPFKRAEEQAKADRAMHDAYVEVAIEWLKDKTIKVAKTLENFAKEVESEVTDAIKTAWEDAVNAANQKGVLGHAKGARNFTEHVKLKIAELGLAYEKRTHKEAASAADKFIASIGAEDAVIQAMNRSNALHGDVRTMIMARAIEYWHDIEINAKTTESKNRAADMQADILDNLDMMSRDIGQQISALNEFYTTSPLGFERYINKKEKRISEEILHQKPRGGTSRLTKIKNSQEALTIGATQAAAKATGKQAKKIFERKPSLSPEKAARKKELAGKFRGMFSDVTNIPALLGNKEFVEYGKLIIEESAGDFREFSKRAIKELGEKVKPILNDWYVKAGGKDYKAAESIGKKAIKSEGIDIGKLAEDHFLEADATKEKLVQKLIDQMGLDPKQAKEIAENLSFYFDKMVAEKRMEVLNRIFPPPRAASLAGKVGVKIRQRENEKIVKAINAGAFDSKKFEKLFYEKFGILDIESPDIAAKLKDFSRRLYEARNKKNSLFYDRAYQDMLDFIEDKRRSKAISRLGDKAITQMYANMLYGYETHIRNTSFNVVKSLAGITSSMASNPKYAPEFLKAFVKELYRGKLEAGEIMKQGYRKSGDPVIEARGIAERINGAWSKYAVVPFRALSAMDAALNFPSRGMKTYQYLIEDAIKANDAKPKDLRKTRSEIVDDVNDIMGYDNISDMAAHAEAMGQIKKEYGVSDLWIDGQRNPKYKAASHNRMYRDYERSVFNIKESSRPEDVVEQAKDWADNALLMGKPRGWFGVVAHGFNAIGRAVPALKVMVTPFVNVPLNVAAHMVEFSPLGYITALRGKEAMFLPKEEAKRWGVEQELLPRKQRQLMAKATAGSVGMAVVYSLTKMEYYDADEKKVRPVLIVYGDGTGNYTDNKKLENLPGSEKFREYSADFMGQRFSYKVNPFAPWFLPAGAMHDYDQYKGGKDKEFSDKIVNEMAYVTWKYMVFIKDQAAVQGLMDLLGVSASIPKNSTEEAAGQMVKDKLKDQVAKIIRTLITPNFIPQAMRDYKGLTDGIESGGYRFIDRFAKDWPFADQFVGKNEDHFGDPIGERFEIPSVVGEERPDNKLYKMAKDHDYLEKLRYFSDRTLWINGQNKILTNGQIDAINKLRNRKAGKVIKDDFNRLNDMSIEDFSSEMNLIYRQAQAEAMDELFGIDGWSNTNPLLKNNSVESSNSEVEEEMPQPQEEFEQVEETIE